MRGAIGAVGLRPYIHVTQPSAARALPRTTDIAKVGESTWPDSACKRHATTSFGLGGNRRNVGHYARGCSPRFGHHVPAPGVRAATLAHRDGRLHPLEAVAARPARAGTERPGRWKKSHRQQLLG